MPTAELSQLAHRHGAWLHVDATHLAGKSDLRFSALGADLMSLSAHKFGGPKGIGALVIRKGLTLPPLLSGRQERQRRGGTENLPGILGLAAAARRASATLGNDIGRMLALRTRLEQGLLRALPGTRLYGAEAERIVNTVCVGFGTLDAEPVLARLERAGVVASSGAACSAAGTEPSHVLLAMGASPAAARGGVRFSLGRDTSTLDIDTAIAAAVRAIAPLLAEASTAATP